MSVAWLRGSLRTWRLKLAFRRRRHAKYHRDNNVAMARKWHGMVEEAHAKIALRNRQIVSKQRKNQKAAAKASGVTRYDGVPVAAWMVPYLQWARANGWRGRLVSGWRDPNYSRSLCMRMCGEPSCPGRCAGLNSNHVGSAEPRGAIDVSEYTHFAALMRRCPLEPRIFNALGARDPVHFSASGN